jgi:hypothetical protein
VDTCHRESASAAFGSAGVLRTAGVLFRGSPLLLLAIVGGCTQPLYSGPSLINSRDPVADRRRFERYDPLPAEDLGPETYSRPRGFEDQRSHTRRAAEGRALLGVPTPDTAPPPTPTSQYQYPGVVRE